MHVFTDDDVLAFYSLIVLSLLLLLFSLIENIVLLISHWHWKTVNVLDFFLTKASSGEDIFLHIDRSSLHQLFKGTMTCISDPLVTVASRSSSSRPP